MRHTTLFPELWNGMDRLFTDSVPAEPRASRNTLGAVDVEESEKGFNLHFDIPGIKKEDVTIEINGYDLKVTGKRDLKKKEDHKGFHMKERHWGTFERSFHLGEEADLESIQATFENGVLEISFEKTQAIQPRQIKIQ